MLFCFFAIYVIWGSTYFAIRVAVTDIPPVFAASLRFLTAGLALYFWSRLRGAKAPSRLEWRSLLILSVLMFLIAYATVFWAETRIPSGIASVLVATTPVWASLFELTVLKRGRWRLALPVAFVMGLAGVVLLAAGSGGRANWLPCLAVLGSSLSWSVGTVWSKELPLPDSKAIAAGAEMALGGAMLLVLSLAIREAPPLPHFTTRGLLALGYLIVAGSIVAFTAYMWLLGHLPATTVASYAYVNPLVALAIGHWLGNEAFGVSALVGSLLIVASVLLILTSSPNKR